MVDQSLVTEGAASIWPSNLTASSQVSFPEFDGCSPRESLHALVNKVTEKSLFELTSVDSLRKLLLEREKDLEVAAKIGQALLQRNEMLESDLLRNVEQKTSLEQQLRQIQHTMARKEELLRLCTTEQEEQVSDAEKEGAAPIPDWIKVLTEECRELRESNFQLQEEADRLRKETADVEQKEKELVQQCLEQFTEAKRRLGDLREEAELKQEENDNLQNQLSNVTEELKEVDEKWEHQVEENDVLKEQLAEAQDQISHLTQAMTELQEKLDDVAVLLKESKDENSALKEANLHQSSSPGESTQADQESIVREIEEVLRKEIIAASTLPERPRSPNHYARQRTMVVMETVRAATLASSRKRFAAKQSNPPPLAASSPSEKKAQHSFQGPPSLDVRPPSPILSENSGALPEELVRYRNQTYVAPEKLQIVKPLEGSVTLLKWKLLASPQLGGATSFFSDASRPGVHLKKWKAGGILDDQSSGLVGTKIKSLSTTDISLLEHNFSPPSRPGHQWKPASKNHTSEKKTDGHSASVNQGRKRHGHLPKQDSNQSLPITRPPGESSVSSSTLDSSNSFLGRVSSFLGSGLSHLGFKEQNKNPPAASPENQVQWQQSESAGLATLLDS